MKATQLIECLKKAIEKYGDVDVATEGCDCWGESEGVDGKKGEYILISRSKAEIMPE